MIAELRVFKADVGDTIPTVNIALSKTVTASRSAAAPSRQPNAAVDGNPDTIWASGGAGPVDFTVDLGKIESINAVGIRFEKGRNPSFGYKVELLDEDNQVVSVVNKIDNFTVKNNYENILVNGDARYVKVYFVRPSSEPMWPGMAELEVFQIDDGVVDSYNVGQTYGLTPSAQNNTNNVNNLVDGNIESRWGAGTSTFPQYVDIDAGVMLSMDEVELVFSDNLMNRFTWHLEYYDATGKLIKKVDKAELVDKATVLQGEVAINTAYHQVIISESVEAAKVRYVVSGLENEADTAWAGLSEFNIIHHAQDLLRDNKASVTTSGNVADTATHLFDDAHTTAWVASGEQQSIIVDLKTVQDINHVTIVHDVTQPLPYEIYTSLDGVGYNKVKDKSDVSEANNTIVEYFEEGHSSRFIKINFTDPNVEASVVELYVYKNEYYKQFKEIVTKYDKLLALFEIGEGVGNVSQSLYDEVLNVYNA